MQQLRQSDKHPHRLYTFSACGVLLLFGALISGLVMAQAQDSGRQQGTEENLYLDPGMAGSESRMTTGILDTLNLDQEIQALVNDGFSESNRSIATCGAWNHSATYGMSIAQGVAGNVLAAVNWLCEETIGGFNTALACAVPNGVYQGFASLVEVGSFCNEANEHDDQVELSHNIRTIGGYVGEQLDEELGSRATVTQGQDAQQDTDSIQSTLDSYFPLYFPIIEQRQEQQADQADVQNQQLTDVQSRLLALQQKQIVLLARLEDTNRRGADAQQEHTEIRNDTQQLLPGLDSASGQVQQLNLNLDARLLKIRHLNLARQLAGLTSGRDFSNALPVFQGGQLERVREMVNESLNMAQAAGFDVSASLGHFAQGDQAYNQNNYSQAYAEYAAAYQLITGPELPGGGF